MPSKLHDLAIYTWYEDVQADESMRTFSVPATTKSGAERKARSEICATYPEGVDEKTDNTRRYYLKLIRDKEPVRSGFLIA